RPLRAQPQYAGTTAVSHKQRRHRHALDATLIVTLLAARGHPDVAAARTAKPFDQPARWIARRLERNFRMRNAERVAQLRESDRTFYARDCCRVIPDQRPAARNLRQYFWAILKPGAAHRAENSLRT